MPWSPLQRCKTPGCPERQLGPRCARHERVSSRNHRGIGRQARGYDRAYELERAELIGEPCALRLAGCTGVADTAQHVDGGGLVPACGHCNYADGAHRAAASRVA